MWKLLIEGFLLGIAYVAPIGTQNLFVINTALTKKRSRVLITSLIIMFFDVTLSLACYFGMGTLIQKSIWVELAIFLIGGLVVMWIGIGLIRSKSSMDISSNTDISIPKIIATGCAVTWFNPQAIIDGTMLLGTSKASIDPNFSAFFIIGFVSASVVWWLVMPFIVSLLKKKISDKVLRVINIVCGILILFYGAKILYNGITLAINTF